MSRGYACVALHNPKDPANVGGAMRAVQVHGGDLIVIGDKRYKKFKRVPTDTTKAYRHIPTLEMENVLDALPHDCVPVAVELVEGAKALPTYVHPERAFYVFGPEDGTLGKEVLSRCRDVVQVPMHMGCMNLAATVNVVLYDRMAKRGRP